MQLLRQLSTFEHSKGLVSTEGQANLIGHSFGASGLNNCVNSRRNSFTKSCLYQPKPQAREAGYDSALQLQVVQGRIVSKSDSA